MKYPRSSDRYSSSEFSKLTVLVAGLLSCTCFSLHQAQASRMLTGFSSAVTENQTPRSAEGDYLTEHQASEAQTPLKERDVQEVHQSVSSVSSERVAILPPQQASSYAPAPFLTQDVPASYQPVYQDIGSSASNSIVRTGKALKDPQKPRTSSPSLGSKSSDPVDFQADNLFYNDQSGDVDARGEVRIAQSGRILTADEVSYNLKQDVVQARGDVTLVDASGDVYRADNVRLSEGQKNGTVDNLSAELYDGARFKAETGARRGGTTTVMRNAAYTPCRVCDVDSTPYTIGEDRDNPPPWQIRAEKVTHDAEEHKISYNNARFEVYGVPIAYTPYFSHPDGTIKRKSGFLTPKGGYRSELGGFVEEKYYWNIAPDKDATVGLIAMTEQLPLLTGEWRQRWDNAGLQISGGVTYAGYTDRIAGREIPTDDELRGHIMAKGLWDVNEQWRSGVNINWASDDQYMRQYDFSSDDVLENEVYAERFSGRNYAVGRLLSFQDTRLRDFAEDQPEVLPEIIASFVGDPNAVPVIGGRWGLDASFLGLQRGGSEQDMNRFSVEGSWGRHLTAPIGVVTEMEATVRGDLYNTRDRNVAVSNTEQDKQTSEVRLFPSFHIESRYPFARRFNSAQAVIEPVAALTLAPNLDVNNDIPNEDSKDAQISAANLFEPNRFPGLDRIEDHSRVTYGLRTGLYDDSGSELTSFIGQSYRFVEDDNPFPEGSGLSRQESDIVGQLTAKLGQDYELDYRYQLGSETFSSQRHEVDGRADLGKFSLRGQYIFASALGGTDIREEREQLGSDVSYYVTPRWRMRTGATHDFGNQPGLRKAYVGLDHYGQCISWSLTGVRNLTDDTSGESDTEILFRIGLKNLGEFEESDLPLSCSR